MNVVFIVLDTVRKDYVSPFNEEVDFTDNIEKIAKEGSAFQNAVAQAPWTLPSHGSMFTGLYPWEHGATQTNLELDVEEDLLAEKLNDEGYRTACFSANPFISKRVGTTAGFDKVETTIGPDRFDLFKSINKKLKAFENRLDFGAFPKAELLLQNLSYRLNRFSGNETENLISKATDFMENNKEDDFFLFMNLMDCHLPLFPDKEYKKKHAEDVNPGKVRQFPHRLISEGEEPDTESLKKLYRAQMDYLDDQIGNLYSFLEDEGLEEETMVVIVGDHGENLGEEGMLGHSFSVSEALVSVPLVVKSPEMKPGRREQQVELRELHDLVLEQVGLEEDIDLGTKYAKGGMDRPEMDLAKIPKSMWDEYHEKLYFVRTPEKKVIGTENGEMTERQVGDGDSVRTSVLEKEVEKLSGCYEGESSGKKVDNMDEEIKNELKNLGYMQKE